MWGLGCGAEAAPLCLSWKGVVVSVETVGVKGMTYDQALDFYFEHRDDMAPHPDVLELGDRVALALHREFADRVIQEIVKEMKGGVL